MCISRCKWIICDVRETSYSFQRISIMLQYFNSVLLHDTLPVDLPDLWPSNILILAFLVFNPRDLYYLWYKKIFFKHNNNVIIATTDRREWCSQGFVSAQSALPLPCCDKSMSYWTRVSWHGQNVAHMSVCLSSELHPAKYSNNYSLTHTDTMTETSSILQGNFNKL